MVPHAVSEFSATVFDSASRSWHLFRDPVELLIAESTAEVKGVLEAVGQKSQDGYYVVGFVAYEAASGLDPAKVHRAADTSMPLVMFGVFKDWTPSELSGLTDSSPALTPELSQAAYVERIGQIKSYLESGDSYQVNFTHRLRGGETNEPRDIFARLYRAQPSRHATLIEVAYRQYDFAICSVSPELFFETEAGIIRCEPMKGTRPRGRYPAEDDALRDELVKSSKDQAENLMIVDMIRNDLGRVAEPGSVTVDELFAVRKLPTVWQLVSKVSARTQHSIVDLFTALFPCASVTGAPRHRTMALIESLEASPRGVYTGALGLVQPGGHSRFSVGIRTLTIDKKRQTTSYGVGGGIVWDSDPMDEWRESLTKGRVLAFDTPDFRLLETLRYDPGQGVYLLDLHLKRLLASARYFDINLDGQAVRTHLESVIDNKSLRLRLLVDHDGTFELERYPIAPVADEVRLALAAEPVMSDDIFLFHKTTHRAVYDRSREGLEAFDDVILWNERGELTETTISNLYIEIDGELLTPDLSSGLLAGTYRQMLIDEGRVRESVLYLKDLQRAERIYVSNSVRNLNPAVYCQDT